MPGDPLEGAVGTPRNEASTIDATSDERAFARPSAPDTRYTVDSEISRGGLGRVMRGHDHNLDRVVAIKQLLMHSARFEARFRREAQITARLQHPGVVPIYETGQLPGGEPFYAMKLVSGHTLKDELARAVTLDDRLALIPKLIAMCDAVAYAHSERVIHRDLKPANVMVGPFGEVLVVDWGLAKDLAASDPDPESTEAHTEEGLTIEGTVMGTPPYLAPEQARGEVVDARADVYALGAMLYQALTGVAPHQSADAKSSLEKLRAGEPIPLIEHEPGAPRELVAIVEQAMARDPAARYPDATALVADLRRFQTGQLVAAHRYSSAMLIRRWLRRHRATVTVSALALIAVGVIGALSVTRIVDERDLARQAEEVAEAATTRARAETAAKEQRTSELVLAQARHWLDLDPTAALAWIKQYAQSAAPDGAEIRALAVDAEQRGAALDLVHGLLATAFADDGTVVGYDTGKHVALWRPGQAITPISAPLDQYRQLAVSRDGRYIAWSDPDIQLWDRTTHTVRRLAPHAAKHTPSSMVFAGESLATGEVDGTIRIISLRDSSVRTFAGHHGEITDLAASPDATMLASWATDPSARLWTLATGAMRVLPAESPVFVMTFSRASDRLAWGGMRMPVHWIDIASPAIHALPGPRPLGTSSLAFSPDGHTLASGGGEGVRIDDLVSGARRELPKGHTDWVNALAYTADARVLVSAQSHGGPIFAWDLVTGDRRSLLGLDTTLTFLRIGDDGVLVTGDRIPQVRRWKIPPAREQVIERSYGDTPVLVALPTGGLAAAHASHPVAWHDLSAPARGPALASTIATELVTTPSGDRIAFGDRAGDVWLWTLATDALAKVDHTNDPEELAISPDGTMLAIGCGDGSVRVVQLGDHPNARTLGKHDTVVSAIAFSPDGKRVATASTDTKLIVWDVAANTSRQLGHLGLAIGAIAFGPDGTLAAGRDRGLVELFAPDGTARELQGHDAEVTQLAYIDQRTLASAGDDGTIRLWDLASGKARVMRHRGHILSLVALPGRRLASGNAVEEDGDATIRIWDVEKAQLVTELHGHARAVQKLVVLADGKRFASLGTDETVRVWPLDPPSALPAPDLAWLDTLSTVVLGDHDVVASP